MDEALEIVPPTQTTSDTVQLGGPIVQFAFTPVPEPSSMTLLASGLVALGAMLRRQMR